MNAEDRFLFLKKLVTLEEEEENEQIRESFLHLSPAEREFRGKALLGLVLKEKHFSPAGHVLATFAKKNNEALPLFSLEIGDIVSLFPEVNPKAFDVFPSGTVYEKSSLDITVAFNQALPDEVLEGSFYQLHESTNRATYRRMFDALDAVRETQNTRLAVFREILLKNRRPKKSDSDFKPDWFNPNLNDSQKIAVQKCIEAEDIALVHGPPGTGKTTVLVELVQQCAKLGKSIFITAPSNTACDNVLERLVEKNLNAVRFGHPARITPALRPHTLDFKLALHTVGKEIQEKEGELERLFRKKSSGKDVREAIGDLKSDLKAMRKEVLRKVMKESQVMVGTLSSIEDRSLRDFEFDYLIMDEATQATEPLCWIPMARVRKVIMAGDHFQLPPTVRSKEAEKQGLGITLFERFHEILGDDFRQLLERQYRMNEKIMGFSSNEFYKGLLVADDSVKHQTLADLKGVEKNSDTTEPFLYVDTAGKGFEEKLEPGSESRYSAEEAHLVIDFLKKYLDAGVPAESIAVISPYSAQVRILTSLSPDPKVEIDSVDGFQGREKELVIVSLVRSNLEGEMGFLADTRRMNVALTRARRKLVVVGDSSTLSSIQFYKDFISYADSIGAYKTAWELS